jgi:hypothetical protein
MTDHLPNLDPPLFDAPPPAHEASLHKPRTLLLYGSTEAAQALSERVDPGSI